MDATTGLCQGCFRTLDEIIVWAKTDDTQRAGILANVARRRSKDTPGADGSPRDSGQ